MTLMIKTGYISIFKSYLQNRYDKSHSVIGAIVVGSRVIASLSHQL